MNLLSDMVIYMEKLAVIIISLLCQTALCQVSDTLRLRNIEFTVVKDDYIQLFIQIDNPAIVDVVTKTPNLVVCFNVEDKHYVAKGTYWFDSATPLGCNCTFLKTIQDNTAVMNDNTLQLVKTPPDKKKRRAWKRVYQKYKPAHYFQYEKRYQDHDFIFCSDGTFVEYQWYRNRWDVPCEKGWIISWGNYEKKPDRYILNSDQALFYLTQDTMTLSDVQSSHVPQDSLFIMLNSSFSRLLSIEDTCSYCKHKHQRIFSYDFIIECGDDQANKEYEKTFNSKFVADTTGVIRAYKPQNIQLKSVFVKVYWKTDHQDTIIIQTSPCRVLKYDSKDYMNNDLCLNVPTLDYAFLTRKNYMNYELKRKGSKSLIWQNMVLKKLSSL